MTQTRKGPLYAELPDSDVTGPSPLDAPPVPELAGLADDHARAEARLSQIAQTASRPASRLARWFWGLLATLLVTLITAGLWQFAAGAMAANPILGWAVTGLLAALALVCVGLILREAAGFARLRRIDSLRHRVTACDPAQATLTEARAVSEAVHALYANRADLRWAGETLRAQKADWMDAADALEQTERALMAPLDAAARVEVEMAARRVASLTALVPLAMADVIGATLANIRMIRRIGDIYGGRAGWLGSVRLVRAVLTQMLATGAIAIGDDMIEPMLGGGLVAKVSRRFGEGLVNGALTARVGIAAMQVCRPMPFAALQPPSLRGTVRRALSGLFKT